MHLSTGNAKRFQSLLQRIAPDLQQQSVNELWQHIHTYYTQPHRHYHTLVHVAQMFAHYDHCESALHDPHAVCLAIWYHDIIYDPTRSDNERLSANYFIETFKHRLPDLLIHTVEAFIMMTAGHQLYNTVKPSVLADAKYFLDMDLAILGQNWQVYKAYAKQVRLEYQHVPLVEYQNGRRAVLKGFLEREQLYFTNDFYVRFDAQARSNIKQEIALLQ